MYQPYGYLCPPSPYQLRFPFRCFYQDMLMYGSTKYFCCAQHDFISFFSSVLSTSPKISVPALWLPLSPCLHTNSCFRQDVLVYGSTKYFLAHSIILSPFFQSTAHQLHPPPNTNRAMATTVHLCTTQKAISISLIQTRRAIGNVMNGASPPPDHAHTDRCLIATQRHV